MLRGRDDLESDHSPVLSGSREHPQCGSYLAHANDLEPAALHRQPVEHRGAALGVHCRNIAGAAVLSRRARSGAPPPWSMACTRAWASVPNGVAGNMAAEPNDDAVTAGCCAQLVVANATVRPAMRTTGTQPWSPA